MPRPGRPTTERAKDFKGTLRQLIRTMSLTYPDLRSKVFGAMQRLPLDGWGPTPHERVKTRERKKEE